MSFVLTHSRRALYAWGVLIHIYCEDLLLVVEKSNRCVTNIMNDSSQLDEASVIISQLKPVQVEGPVGSESNNSNNNNNNTIMTAYNPTIQQDTIDDDRERSSSSSNTNASSSPSNESPTTTTTKGKKRKSRMDVSSHAVNGTAADADVMNMTGNSTNISTADQSSDPTTTTAALAAVLGGSKTTTGRWTSPEHDAFVHGLSLYGREWKRVALIIPTRTAAQVRSHAQKYFQHLDQQQQQSQEHQDVMIQLQKLHERDTFDFTFIGPSPDVNHIPNSDTSMISSEYSDVTTNNSITINNININTMTDSVREQAVRIMANPTSVHHEVNVTLQQLRQRYCELQNRLALLQQEQQSPSSNNHLNHSHCSRSSGSTSNDPMDAFSPENRNLDEQIVVQVLQARLQQIPLPNHQNQHQHIHNDNSTSSMADHPTSDYDGDIETDTDEMNI